MPDPVTGLIAGSSLLSGAMSADAAGDASDAQLTASREGTAELRRQFDLVQSLLQPYVQAGNRGLQKYEWLLGTQGDDLQRSEINRITNGPQFGALVKQGEDAILANASATGGLRGGNVQAALANTRTNILNGLIDQQLTRYGQLGTAGQNSAAGVGNAALGTGTGVANLMQQGGAAQAGGIIAGSNAITNALGGIGGLLGARGQFGGGVGGGQAAFSQTPLGSSGFGSGLAYGNQDLGAYF